MGASCPKLCSESQWENSEDEAGADEDTAASAYRSILRPILQATKKCIWKQYNWTFILSIHIHLFFCIPKPASSFFFLQVPESHPLFLPLLFMSFAIMVLKHSPSSPASWNCPSLRNPSDLYFFTKHIA